MFLEIALLFEGFLYRFDIDLHYNIVRRNVDSSEYLPQAEMCMTPQRSGKLFFNSPRYIRMCSALFGSKAPFNFSTYSPRKKQKLLFYIGCIKQLFGLIWVCEFHCVYTSVYCFHIRKIFNEIICCEDMLCSNHMGPISAIKNSIMGGKKINCRNLIGI